MSLSCNQTEKVCNRKNRFESKTINTAIKNCFIASKVNQKLLFANPKVLFAAEWNPVGEKEF